MKLRAGLAVDGRAVPTPQENHRMNRSLSLLALLSMHALHQNPAVVLKACQQGQGHFWVESVSGIDLRHMLAGLGKCMNLQGAVNAKYVPHRHPVKGRSF